MVEGSTGGAGVSADFKAIGDGEPVPLSATLLYVARSGVRAGQVLAYDEVTVGGFGLVSVSLQRTVVREAGAAPRAGLVLPRGGSTGGTPSSLPSPTGTAPSAIVVPPTAASSSGSVTGSTTGSTASRPTASATGPPNGPSP